MKGTKIRKITSVGTVHGTPYVGMESEPEEQLSLLFDEQLTGPLISAFAMAANHAYSKKGGQDVSNLPNAVRCKAAGGYKVNGGDMGLLLTLVDGPTINFSLPPIALRSLLFSLQEMVGNQAIPAEKLN